jgi:hypothetical protein
MPLSRLDLPPIEKAIQELYRIVEQPTAKDWKQADWLIAQHEREIRQIGIEMPKPQNLSYVGIVDAAAKEVMYEIAGPDWILPPIQFLESSCAEIDNSSLDSHQKVALHKLWKKLRKYLCLPDDLSKKRGEALEFLEFLETVLKQLNGKGEGGGAVNVGAEILQGERAGTDQEVDEQAEEDGRGGRKRRGRPTDSDPEEPNTEGAGAWRTVSDAARASGCTNAQISGAVRDGQLKSNGQKRRKRRIDAADLVCWQLRRSKREGAVESDATVEAKLKRAQDEERNYRPT